MQAIPSLILEAMKMQNNIRQRLPEPSAGIRNVNKGDAVMEGDPVNGN